MGFYWLPEESTFRDHLWIQRNRTKRVFSKEIGLRECVYVDGVD